MTTKNLVESAYILDAEKGLQNLIATLAAEGYQVIGPKREDEAIVYGELAGASDLPVGLKDEQEGGKYRLVKGPRRRVLRLRRRSAQLETLSVPAEAEDLPDAQAGQNLPHRRG